jgi:acetoin utilization deacetylase AcuC-like enzyme
MAHTGIVRDNRYLDHGLDQGHPENRRRLESIYSLLDGADMRGLYQNLPSRAATAGEILQVHSADHLRRLEQTRGRASCALTPDTVASAGSFEAAVSAAGGLLAAIEAVVAGDIRNAFVLARPPGHHAERSRAMGFCLLNNVAVGAAFALRELGLRRVMVIDWDVHHGNGTQHAFENDPSVLFFSLHQYPHFPGTGLYTETGIGRGEGYTVNAPMPKHYGDAEYLAICRQLLPRFGEAFAPELVLVSAGFDTHAADPLGGMKMTAAGFAALTACVMELADTYCDGRLVLCLEGGYHPEALAESVRSVLLTLSRGPHALLRATGRPNRKKVDHVLKRVLRVHRPYWKSLAALERAF